MPISCLGAFNNARQNRSQIYIRQMEFSISGAHQCMLKDFNAENNWIQNFQYHFFRFYFLFFNFFWGNRILIVSKHTLKLIFYCTNRSILPKIFKGKNAMVK